MPNKPIQHPDIDVKGTLSVKDGYYTAIIGKNLPYKTGDILNNDLLYKTAIKPFMLLFSNTFNIDCGFSYSIFKQIF